MKQFYNSNIRWLLIALTLLSVSLSTLAQSIQVTNVATTPVCAGGSVTITFDVTNGSQNNGQRFKSSGTAYTANLVLAGSPTQSLGTLTPTLPSGGYSGDLGGKTTGITGTVTIPVGTLTNSAYTISVTSTGPSATGTSSVFTVNAKPSAPTVTVVNNCNGTSTLTASNYTGSLLWSNGTTTAVNTINTAGTYTVTQTVSGCVSDNGSGIAAPKTTPSAPTANNVTITYDGSAHTATATAQPEASVSYYTDPALGSLTAAPTKTDAGTYTVWAESSSNGCVSTSRTQVTLAIQKAASAIALTVGGPYTYDNTAKSVTSATVSGAGGLSTNAVVTYSQSGSPVASPINAGSYDVVASYAGDANHEAATNATGNLVIGKATATLALSNLSYTYDGTAKSVTVTTNPAGLSGVSVSGDNQTNAGTYPVTASLDNANYTATPATGNLVIGKATATLALSNLSYTYDGTAKSVTVTTNPAGLSGVSVSGDNQTNAGTYPVTASLDNANYTATPATGNLVIGKATATLALSGLSYTYDGTAKSVTVTTNPAGLSGVSVSGDNQTNAGTYPVTASLDNANYTATPATGNLVIGKATASLALSNLSYTYDGTAKSVTVTTNPAGLSGVSVSGDNQTNAGTYPVTASLDNANYTATPATGNLVIGKATATLALSNLSYTYDGTAKSVTVTTNPAGLSGVSVSGDNQTNAGTYPVTASLDNANYTATPATGNLVIGKATATLALSGLSYTYDGTAKSVTVTTNPAGLSGVSVSGDNQTNAGTYPVTASLDNANYTATPATGNLVIGKATASLALSNLSYTYDGTAKSVTVTTNPAGLSGVSVSGDNQTNAGTYPVTASLDNANYTATPATGNLVIGKATATLALSNLSYTYDGTAKSVTVTTNPAGLSGVSVSGDNQTNAGTYPVTASLDNANYTATPATGNLVIGKATATLALSGLSYTYDGTAKSVTVTTNPAGLSGVSVSGDNQTNAGTYPVTASLDNANYTATPATGNLVIGKATASLALSNLSYTYDGTAKSVTVTTNPAGLSGVSVSGDNQTNAGTYPVTASLDNANYTATPATGNLVIGKATATLALSNLSYTYDGTAKSVTVTTNPAGLSGVSVSGDNQTNAGTYPVTASLDNANYTATPATGNLVIGKATATLALSNLSYTYDGTAKSVTVTTNPAGLSGVSVSGDNQTNAGTYPVTASLDNANYTATPATGNLVIGKATATLALSGLSYTYDGTAKSVTVTTNPAGLSGVSVSGDNQTNAGTYPVTASLDNANYTATPATGNLVIGKADAVVMVTGYTGTYDGLAHGATGTAKGVGGVDVGTLNLGSTFTNVPGGTANWTFDGGTNYTSTSGSVTILINKANAVVSVAGYTGVYNGAAHGATGSATGAGGTNLSASLSLGNTFTNVPGGSANWTFTGGTNYEDQSGSVAISINKATASVTPNAKSKIYGAAEPALDGGLTGFVAGDGITASYARALGETVSGSPYLITATLSPEAALANYTITYNTANFTITKKPVSVVADAKTKVYGTANPALTYTFSPALITPDAFTGSLSVGADTYSNVGAYDITQGSLDLGPNYTITYTPAKLTITPQTANPLADAFYTGATFFWTQGATSANATLTLSATLKNSPNYGGDIRTAKVSFFIRNGSSKTPIAGAQNLPVGLVNVDDLTVGAAATTVQYNIGNADVSTLNIGIDVSGNYTANPSAAFDKVITVAKPIPGGQIAGGADISANGSVGYIKGASNVGFFVQYNKSLKNPQGGVDLKITSSLNRSGVADGSTHTYKIKSNAISVLSVGKPTNQDAQFTSKANVAEIIDGVEQSIEGNCTLQFDMTDVGASGAGDKVGITVYRNGGGVWYSSNWDGTKTILKAIEANGQVSVSTAGARLAADEAELNLVLDAYPNPMRDVLKISVSGLSEQPTAQVKLYNLLQRVAGEWTLDIQNGKGEKTIDLRTLEVGTYLLSVEGNQKRTVTRVLKVD